MIRTLFLLLLSMQLQAQDSLFLKTDIGTPFEDNSCTIGTDISTTDGTITAIKFFKVNSSTASHTINVWSNSTTKIYSQNYSSATTGWQRIPVNIPVSAGTYTVSVFIPISGQIYWYKKTVFPKTSGTITGKVGRFGYTSGFPASTSTTSNYVDIVFKQKVVIPLIVNAGKDSTAVWPCDSIKIQGTISGDNPKFIWTIDNQWGDVSVSGLTTLTPVVHFKAPDSGVSLILTGSDANGTTSEHGAVISVMPDFEPYIKRMGDLILNQLRLEMIRKWKAGE